MGLTVLSTQSTDIVANIKYPSVITGIMVKGGENQFCVLTDNPAYFQEKAKQLFLFNN